VPVFAGRQEDLVNAVLQNEAAKHRAPIQFLTEDFRAYREQDRMVFDADDVLLDLPRPALIGSHQIDNAGVAIATARSIGLSDKAIVEGLKSVTWPARLQNLTTGPFADMMSESGGELWLDGGHNPHAAAALANVMAELQDKNERVLVLVMGILGQETTEPIIPPRVLICGSLYLAGQVLSA